MDQYAMMVIDTVSRQIDYEMSDWVFFLHTFPCTDKTRSEINIKKHNLNGDAVGNADGANAV